VRLEEPAPRHAGPFLASVRRSRELHRNLVSPPGTPKRFRAYLASLQSASRLSRLVVTQASDEIVGVVTVSEIVRGAFRSAYLGYYGFVPHVGRGFMRQGMEQVIRHCFGELRLHRLEANIQPGNLPSIALVRRLGFRLEGYSPRYLKVAGRWRDHERWAILAEEWRTPNGKGGTQQASTGGRIR